MICTILRDITVLQWSWVGKEVEMTNVIFSDNMSTIAIVIASVLVLTSISTLSVQAQEQKNITAFIHFNEEAIRTDGDLSDAYFTVNGEKYGNIEYDMSDWVNGDESFPDPDILAQAHPKELVVPDNIEQICLTDEVSYSTCVNLRDYDTEAHFIYPASYPNPNSN